MPLFTVSKSDLRPVAQSKFTSEKVLQQLIERNLDAVFKCQLVASEFPTGAQHAGRIDTLALSEDSRSQGDFEIAAQKALGPKIEVDWSDVRAICIAPNYRKYDLHAVAPETWRCPSRRLLISMQQNRSYKWHTSRWAAEPSGLRVRCAGSRCLTAARNR